MHSLVQAGKAPLAQQTHHYPHGIPAKFEGWAGRKVGILLAQDFLSDAPERVSGRQFHDLPSIFDHVGNRISNFWPRAIPGLGKLLEVFRVVLFRWLGCSACGSCDRRDEEKKK